MYHMYSSTCFLVQEVALDYIGKRGSAVGVVKEKRIQYALEILQRELFPHIGVEELFETKKVGSLGAVCICICDHMSASHRTLSFCAVSGVQHQAACGVWQVTESLRQ